MKESNLGDAMRAFGWGLLLGGAAGLAAGLLAAPEEGSKLRRRVSYRLENIAKQVSDLADRIVHPETQSEARLHGDAVVAEARERAENIRRDIDTLLGDVRRQTPSAE